MTPHLALGRKFLPIILSALLYPLLVAPLSSETRTALADRVQAAAEALPPMDRHQIASNPDQYLQRIAKLFRQHGNGNRITAEDFRRIEAVRFAEERAKVAGRLLRRDVNGDGVITEEEYLAHGGPGGSSTKEAVAALIERADMDGDGLLGLEEILASAGRTAAEKAGGRGVRLQGHDLRQFDVDGDGDVAAEEVVAVVRAVVAAASARAKAAREPSAAPQPAPQGAGTCRPPARPAGAQVVILSGHAGTGMSSVAVDGMDRTTSVASIEIEPGGSPLYIFASATRPTIWRVRGSTDRVARFVAEPRHVAEGPGTGVLGLPPEAVTFLPEGACAEAFVTPATASARRVVDRLAWRLGVDAHEVTVVAYSRLHAVRLPSGEAQVRSGAAQAVGGSITGGRVQVRNGIVPSRDDRAVQGQASAPPRRQALPNSRRAPAAGRAPANPTDRWRPTSLGRLKDRLHALFPDGLIEIDPAELLAPGPVARYDVLPGQAGMIQLLESGAMREVAPGTFLLQRAIPRFPAELSEPPNVRIVIGQGVPVPKGKPGRTKVFLLETGSCISEAHCR